MLNNYIGLHGCMTMSTNEKTRAVLNLKFSTKTKTYICPDSVHTSHYGQVGYPTMYNNVHAICYVRKHGCDKKVTKNRKKCLKMLVFTKNILIHNLSYYVV